MREKLACQTCQETIVRRSIVRLVAYSAKQVSATERLVNVVTDQGSFRRGDALERR